METGFNFLSFIYSVAKNGDMEFKALVDFGRGRIRLQTLLKQQLLIYVTKCMLFMHILSL